MWQGGVKMLKRILATILAFAALWALARCGPTAEQPPEEPQAPTAEPGGSEEGERLAALAAADLASHLGIDGDQVIVHTVVPAQFPDSSLGVREPGRMYAQVITWGYIMHLEVDGKFYQYNGSGDRVVRVPEQ